MTTISPVRGSRVESRSSGAPRPAAARAFSLIEVLIAILILALGLLGLGAVIPVIVKQQRNATDLTLGIAASKQAEAYIRSRPEFDPTSNALANAWRNWLTDTTWSPTTGTNEYLWQPWRNAVPEMSNTYPTAGDMTFIERPSNNVNSTVTIKLEDRLWPNTSTQPVEFLSGGLDPYRPMFVWDIIGRRIQVDPRSVLNDPQAARSPEQIQIAIFVRRIDQNIRIPRLPDPANPGANLSITLLDVLVPSRRNILSAADACVPVAVEGPNNPTPTNRGTSAGGLYYGEVQTLIATFDPANRDRIELSGGTQFQYDLAARPGQRLLDNLGNIYAVREAYDDGTGSNIILVDPPVPPYVTDQPPGDPNVEIDHSLRQVIFTPQIPGAVRVFTVTRPIP